MIWLLDSSVLIALTDEEHTAHDHVVAWLGATRRFASCPITEGALVRYLVRLGAAHGSNARLATLDHGLASARPGTVELIPGIPAPPQ